MKKLLLILAAIFVPFMVFGQLLTTYEYDELNRLVQVNYPNGQQVEYAYDVLGNRISQTVSQLCAIQVVVNPEGSGTVSGVGIYEPQSLVTLTAQPNSGFVFTNWTENGEVVSTENPYEFVAYSNRNLIASFEEDLYYHFIIPGNWSEPSNWSDNTLPGTNAMVFIDAPCQLDQNVEVAALTVSDGQSLTLQSGKILTVTGNLANMATAGLVIEDSAQLVHNVANVQATVKKHISPFNGTDDSWHLIALPLTGSSNVTFVTNLLEGEYDLYGYDESTTCWKNSKASRSGFTELEATRGYLYANEAAVTLGFSGTLENSSNTVSVPLSYTDEANLSGFNLVGNPFPCNAYLNRDYYVLKPDGTGINPVAVSSDTPIPPCTAVFVKAEAEGETVEFTRVPYTKTF